MAKPPSQAVATRQTSEVAVHDRPDYLSGVAANSGLTGLDANDFVVPRVKLLQSVSEEVDTFDDAEAGQFWLNVMDTPLGDELEFIICANKKRVLLLPPMGDARGILARSDDGIHWSPPNGKWDVKLKGVRNPVTWETKATVRESGLLEFGSSNPEDPDSNPAATLFYEYLVYLPKFPELSPCLLSLARSQAKKAKDLNGKVEMRKAPMQAQKFQAKTVKETSSEGDYYNYQFVSSGWASQDQFEGCKAISDRFKEYVGAGEENAARESTGKAEESKEF